MYQVDGRSLVLGQEAEMENVKIRSACKEDVPGILWLIQVIQIH